MSGLGMFLIVLGLLLRFWAPGAAEKTPLNVDSTTYLSGSAQKLNPATNKVEDLPVKVTSLTTIDPKKSDDKVITFISKTCVVIDRNNVPDCVSDKDADNRLITATTEAFAADRHTGLAVNDSKYVKSTVERKGLLNKFPFDTKKKTYKLWDGLLGATADAKFTGTTKQDGLDLYKFSLSVPTTNAQILEGVDGTYSTEKTYLVEPFTGAIVDQTQHEIRKLPDGGTVLDLNIKFTDAQVKSNIKDAKANSSTLKLIHSPLWIVLVLLGALLALLGIRTQRRSAGAGRDDVQTVETPKH